MEGRGGVEVHWGGAAEHKGQREMELRWVKRNTGAERGLEHLRKRDL